MNRRDKFLIGKAIEAFMTEDDSGKEDSLNWEAGMDILSHLIGKKSTFSRQLIKRLIKEFREKP